MFSKLVCRSLSRIAMITNINFPVQTKFTIHAHIFAVYSCPRLHFIDPININRATHFFHIFLEGSHLNIKEDILKYTSPNFDSFIIFLKLSGLNVELITYTKNDISWEHRGVSSPPQYLRYYTCVVRVRSNV